MPFAAPRPCTKPGCGALVYGGDSRCDQHKRAERREADAKRGSSSERGYSAAWQRARIGFLRSHPLCVKHAALDEVVASTVVDHIVPHRGDKVLFWDHDNWQALCKPCHDVKTATEDGGFGRK
ncbi:MAG: HNH endonuclease [Pseudomonadota bacterium]